MGAKSLTEIPFLCPVRTCLMIFIFFGCVHILEEFDSFLQSTIHKIEEPQSID